MSRWRKPPVLDLYAELEIPADASGEAIRTAYRRLARTVHADTAAHADHARMVRLNQAYALLSVPARRVEYDAGCPMGEVRRSERDAPPAATPAAPSGARASAPVRPLASSEDYRRAFSGLRFPTSRDAVMRAARDRGGVDREVGSILSQLPRRRFRDAAELAASVRAVYVAFGVAAAELPI